MIKRLVVMAFLASLALPVGAANAQGEGCGNSLVVQALEKLQVEIECKSPIKIGGNMVPPTLTINGTVTKLIITNREGGKFDVADLIAAATGVREGSAVKVNAVLKTKWDGLTLKNIILDIKLFTDGTRDASIIVTESGGNAMKEIKGYVTQALLGFLNGGKK